MRRVIQAAALPLIMAQPALATLGDGLNDGTYRGICQMSEICTATGACGVTPSLGEMLLVTGEDGTRMGRNEDDLAPVDHYITLEDAMPLPRIDGHRRTFLVDLPSEGATRRFAVHVQLIDAETGWPVLRPQYFVLACEVAPA